MSNWCLETQSLTRRFGSRVAVDSLDVRVAEGEIYGFLGPNGAGKTTAIRCMLGLIRKDAGTVKIFGREDPIEQRTFVGAMVETPAFHDSFTAMQNLRYASAYSGQGTKADIDWAFDLVGLGGREDDPVRAYSLGMRQRLGIARALVSRPQLLILDEPTNGLDPRGMKEMRDLLHKLSRQEGTTIFVSSHLLGEVEQLCSRVGILEKGKLITEGRVQDLLAQVQVARAVEVQVRDLAALDQAIGGIEGAEVVDSGDERRLRVHLNGIDVPEFNKALVQANVEVEALVPVEASLEDLFMHITSPGVT